MLNASKLESDKKRKQQESQILDLQQQLSESNENKRQTLEQLDKAREELDSLSRAREQEEVQLSAMTRKIVTLEEQITELTEKLQVNLSSSLRNITS